MSAQVELRPATPEDEPFLISVYASTREAELAQTPWDDEGKAAFVAQQFAAQDHHYRAHYGDFAYDIVLVDGEPAGRLLVACRTDEIRIMDIALLPAHRGRGAATKLIGNLLAEAARAGAAVSIHVEKQNPAATLYRRLGFEPVEEVSSVYDRWEARPQT